MARPLPLEELAFLSPKLFALYSEKWSKKLTKTTGNTTFVDMAMSYTGSPLHSEYGKVLFKQQQYTRNHTVEHLSGLSSEDMTKFPLLTIPEVTALHTTNRTITSGSWQVVTKNDPKVATLIDEHLHNHFTTHTFNFPPNCSKKVSKLVTEGNKNAWISQNNNFTATAPARKNTWIQPPKITRPKTIVKSDDCFTSTLNARSSQRDNLDKITCLVQALQESETANKKMREAFSHSLQAQTTLQDEELQLKWAKPTSISNTDSVFTKLQSKPAAKFEAIATKTSTALDLFHQKLEAQKASTIKANNHLDSRMSQIEYSTKQIVNNMTSIRNLRLHVIHP